MIASFKSHLATVNLVMRSVLQTRTQPTTILLSIVPVIIELYLLAASAMWAIMSLSASSCEQGASPSLSLGCRTIASLSIAQMTYLTVDNVTIYMLRNANSDVSLSLILSNSHQFLELHYWALLCDEFISISCSVFALLNNLVCSCPTRRQFCVIYPVDVPHRVGTHPGHAYTRKVPEAAGFSTHNMAGPSNMTTSTLGVMSYCFSRASSRHRTMSDLVPSLSFPLADSDGGHG